ncbi:MAG: ABC transporter permease, partial [Abitibacteriaceae bacterium]|nr:ABC transporter permease [Abditibacteriaceae bacterium]
MNADRIAPGPNPVFVRETRVRWRGHAFTIIFSYVVLLAIMMLGVYWSSATQIEVTPNPLRRMAQIGHSLFLNLSWVQTLGCLLLAPALTATSIAVEREQGLLESLQVAPLSARHIVSGKLLSVLLFMGLLLLATLPIASLCFLMGGVSPAEFAIAALLQAITVLTGATVGLFCSAWTRRASSAMTFTWIFILLWGIGSFSAVFVARIVTHDWITQLFGDTNPVLAVVALIEPQFRRSRVAMGGFDVAPWEVSLAFQLLLTPLLLWLAVRGVRKPLNEPYWMEASKKSGTQPQTIDAAPDPDIVQQGRQEA